MNAKEARAKSEIALKAKCRKEEKKAEEHRQLIRDRIEIELPRFIKQCFKAIDDAVKEGKTQTTVMIYSEVAYHAMSQVTYRLYKDGFKVSHRRSLNFTGMNVEGMGGRPNHYAQWDISW